MRAQVLMAQAAQGARHLPWMLHGQQPHLGMRRQFPLAMPVTWRLSGLSKMNQESTLPSDSWLMAQGSFGASDSGNQNPLCLSFYSVWLPRKQKKNC